MIIHKARNVAERCCKAAARNLPLTSDHTLSTVIPKLSSTGFKRKTNLFQDKTMPHGPSFKPVAHHCPFDEQIESMTSSMPGQSKQWLLHIVSLLVLLCCMFHTKRAFADCSYRNGSTGPATITIALPAQLTLQPNTAPGTVIYDSGSVYAPNPVSWQCATTFSYISSFTQPQTPLSSSLQWTYATNVSGIGFRATFGFIPSDLFSNPVFPLQWPANSTPISEAGKLYGPAGLGRFQLVVTGPIGPGPSTITFASPLGSFNASSALLMNMLVPNTSIVSVRPTCSVVTPNLQVPLGRAPASDFKGIGSTANETPFSINLQCEGAPNLSSNLYMTLTDQTNTANVTNVLSLTAASTAKGVGIQVLKDGAVLGYGPESDAPGTQNQWFAGNPTNGTFNIPLSARYVQTDATVTAGSADGIAVFTMSYQ